MRQHHSIYDWSHLSRMCSHCAEAARASSSSVDLCGVVLPRKNPTSNGQAAGASRSQLCWTGSMRSALQSSATVLGLGRPLLILGPPGNLVSIFLCHPPPLWRLPPPPFPGLMRHPPAALSLPMPCPWHVHCQLLTSCSYIRSLSTRLSLHCQA